MIYGKVPPQAMDLEDSLLGALMLVPSAIDEVSTIITSDSFYVEANQRIYKAICWLSQANQPTDILSVTQKLRSTDELDIVGGPFYVTQLTNKVVNSSSVAHHSRIIQQKFIQRELIRVSGEILEEAYEDSADAFELLDMAEEKLLAISTGSVQSDLIPMSGVLIKAVQQIEKWRTQEKAITGIPSGFSVLDRATRGWQNGDLIVLAARPSIGKTALALHLAKQASSNLIMPVVSAIWSLEMKSERLVLRQLASESGIHLHRIQTGMLDDEQMKKLYQTGIQKLHNLPIFFDDSSNTNLLNLRAKARRLKKKNNLGLIILDYMQLVNGTGEGNREQEVAKISRGLKLLAKELDIPIIALSQLSREVEKRSDKQPMLSDLRESGSIEQDADVVIFLWGPTDKEVEENQNLITRRYARIAKARDGMLASISLEFENDIQRFSEAVSQKSNWRPVPNQENLFNQGNVD